MCMQKSTQYNVHWNVAGVPVLKEKKKSESLSQRHTRLVGKNVPTPYLFKALHLWRIGGIIKTWVLDLCLVSLGVKRQRCTDYKFTGHKPGDSSFCHPLTWRKIHFQWVHWTQSCRNPWLLALEFKELLPAFSSCSHSMEWLQTSLSGAKHFRDIEQTEAIVAFHSGSSPSILLGMSQKMCLQQVTAQALTAMTFLPSLGSFMETPGSYDTSCYDKNRKRQNWMMTENS